MSSRRSGPAHVAKDPDDPLNETMAHPLVHAKAQSWVPDVSIKPSSMWVAIVFHDVQSVSDMKEDATFLWIKCFPKICIRTLKYQYFKLHPLEDFELKHLDYYPSELDQVQHLCERSPFHGSNVIVLRAVEDEHKDEIDYQDRKTLKLASKLGKDLYAHQAVRGRKRINRVADDDEASFESDQKLADIHVRLDKLPVELRERIKNRLLKVSQVETTAEFLKLRYQTCPIQDCGRRFVLQEWTRFGKGRPLCTFHSKAIIQHHLGLGRLPPDCDYLTTFDAQVSAQFEEKSHRHADGNLQNLDDDAPLDHPKALPAEDSEDQEPSDSPMNMLGFEISKYGTPESMKQRGEEANQVQQAAATALTPVSEAAHHLMPTIRSEAPGQAAFNSSSSPNAATPSSPGTGRWSHQEERALQHRLPMTPHQQQTPVSQQQHTRLSQQQQQQQQQQHQYTMAQATPVSAASHAPSQAEYGAWINPNGKRAHEQMHHSQAQAQQMHRGNARLQQTICQHLHAPGQQHHVQYASSPPRYPPQNQSQPYRQVHTYTSLPHQPYQQQPAHGSQLSYPPSYTLSRHPSSYHPSSRPASRCFEPLQQMHPPQQQQMPAFADRPPGDHGYYPSAAWPPPYADSPAASRPLVPVCASEMCRPAAGSSTDGGSDDEASGDTDEIVHAVEEAPEDDQVWQPELEETPEDDEEWQATVKEAPESDEEWMPEGAEAEDDE